MANKAMLEQMIVLQDRMNCVVNPNWKDAGYDWNNGIMVEAVEAFDHTSWKWWKSKDTPMNIDQVRLEIVDTWHFIISKSLVEIGSEATLSLFSVMLDRVPVEGHSEEVHHVQSVLKEIILEAALNRHTGTQRILPMLIGVGYMLQLSFPQVYRLYLAKNTLNIFRQHNGYNEGTYIKDWNGKEDNEVLTSLTHGMTTDEMTFDTVYAKLGEVYSTLNKG